MQDFPLSHAPLSYGHLGLAPRQDGRASLLTQDYVGPARDLHPRPHLMVATGQRPLRGRDASSMAWAQEAGIKLQNGKLGARLMVAMRDALSSQVFAFRKTDAKY